MGELLEVGKPVSWGDLVGAVGIVLTLIAIGLVLYQIHISKIQTALARDQTHLSQRQLDIVLRQDTIMNRRANLSMQCAVQSGPNGRIEIFFWATNSGEKSARDFYWYLYIPDLVASYRSVDDLRSNSSMKSEGPFALDGVRCAIFRKYHDEPLYPSRRVKLARIVLDSGEPGRDGFHFFWQVVAEDGAFPSSGSHGRGEVMPEDPI